MNNESKTPETIWAWDDTTKMALGYWIDDEPVSKREVTKYYRDDLYAEAMRQNAALKAFVVSKLPDAVWGTNAPYAAYELGIMVKDIEHHDEEEALKFSPWMLTDAAMPLPSKAQVAREFLDELYGTGLSAEVLALIMRKVWEWEAAEEKC